MLGAKPALSNTLPASIASSFPFSESPTSTQPVNLFSLFHSLCP